jgi:hypothetical protein
MLQSFQQDDTTTQYANHAWDFRARSSRLHKVKNDAAVLWVRKSKEILERDAPAV